MPHLRRDTTFDLVAVFCFAMAAIQFFLAHNPRPAGAFAIFGVVALLAGFLFHDEAPGGKAKDEQKPS